MSRWPLTPRGTGAVVLAIGCFVAAHAFRIVELIFIGVLLLSAVAASLITLTLARRTETVARAFHPDVASAGSEVEVRLRVKTRSPIPAAQGRWRDTLPDGVDGDAWGVFPATGSSMRSGGEAVELGYTVTAERRGVRLIGPLSVVATDPFGFARRRHTIGRPLPLTITPQIIDLGPLIEQPGEAGGSMHTATDQLGQGSDNLIPRVYVPGDSMRRIHWRASAHRDQLMVRQEEQETTPEATVILDTARARWDDDASRSPGADPDFETAISLCASAAARLVQEGYVVTVRSGDGMPLADPIAGGDAVAVEQLAIDLATLTAHGDAAPNALVALFAGVSAGPVVVITGALGEADAAALAPLAHHSALPLLIALATEHRSLERLTSAGWRALALSGEDDPAAVWSVLVDRGGHRVEA